MLLFAYEENADRSIVDDILNLLLAACCVERNCNGTNAECSKVSKDVLNGILGEYTDVLLNIYTKVKKCV